MAKILCKGRFMECTTGETYSEITNHKLGFYKITNIAAKIIITTMINSIRHNIRI